MFVSKLKNLKFTALTVSLIVALLVVAGCSGSDVSTPAEPAPDVVVSPGTPATDLGPLLALRVDRRISTVNGEGDVLSCRISFPDRNLECDGDAAGIRNLLFDVNGEVTCLGECANADTSGTVLFVDGDSGETICEVSVPYALDGVDQTTLRVLVPDEIVPRLCESE